MPELPEVETTRRALLPHLQGRRILAVHLRRPDLRWPIPPIFTQWRDLTVQSVQRRAKYLLIDAGAVAGSALIHLGMSGSLRVLPEATPAGLHDHWDWQLEGGEVLRYNDPRRFGCLLHQPADSVHPLLAGLGPEPLDSAFDAAYLYTRSRGRHTAIKTFLMDQAVVVGVGNIYAAESLHAAGIHPLRAAGSVSRARYARLVDAVRRILEYAIGRGGTTLRDFLSPDGTPGYFELELQVYGRGGEPCHRCGRALRQQLIGQRTSVWCGHCQR